MFVRLLCHTFVKQEVELLILGHLQAFSLYLFNHSILQQRLEC